MTATIFTTYNDNGQMIINMGGAAIAVQNAELTNRSFPGWWGDAEDGDEYTTEFAAQGTDQNGNLYAVTWRFAAVRGEEPEPDCLPWDDADCITVAMTEEAT